MNTQCSFRFVLNKLICVIKNSFANFYLKEMQFVTHFLVDDIQVSVKDEDDGRQVAVSTLSISPNSDDNNAYYSCETESSITSEKFSVGVSLDVLCK